MERTLPSPAAPLRRIYQRRTAAFIRTRHVDLRRRGLRLGCRIVLVSDLHARDDWFARHCVASLVQAINAVVGAHLVVLVGDFVGDDPSAIVWAAEELSRIEAPRAGVLGNHDHWTDAALVTEALEQVGDVRMLTNRAVPLADLTRSATSAWVAGIDSCWTRRRKVPGADPDAAFADVPDDVEVVVLGHEPHLATLHEHVLHLAGHTHCGQVRTPLLGDWTARMHMPRFSEPYPCWLHELAVEPAAASPANRRTGGDRRWVYTTAGVGYSTVDFRLFCPPEIVVLDT